MQNPHYVWSQYESWYWCLKTDMRDDYAMSLAYRDFYLLTRWVGHPPPPEIYQGLQLLTAALVAAMCVLGRWVGWSKQYLVHSLMLLGCCWLIVFGPATESCTYILLAPGMAWALVDAFASPSSIGTRVVLTLVFGLCMTNSIANWFPDAREWCFPLQPLAARTVLSGTWLACVGRLGTRQADCGGAGPGCLDSSISARCPSLSASEGQLCPSLALRLGHRANLPPSESWACCGWSPC